MNPEPDTAARFPRGDVAAVDTPGDAVRLIREREGHTREYMADVCGLSAARLARIEDGTEAMPVEMVPILRECWGWCPYLLVALAAVAAAGRADRPADVGMWSLTHHRELLGLGDD